MKKLFIYQVLPRLWGNGHFSAWDHKALSYLKRLGIDFIWFTGVPRHASGKPFVKGDPGSPYAISDWYDVNPYLADNEPSRMLEFELLVKRVHEHGMKVITDFIPNHVAPDYNGPAAVHDWCDADWTDTRKLDYSDGRTEAELSRVLDFWASKGVDGFRCDMVELVPAENMKRMIAHAREAHPQLLFIAEVYNTDNYRMYSQNVGFDLLYDKSGMYDRLRAINAGHASARELTWNWQALGDLQPAMLNFLENHDEQRVASPWFAGSTERSWAMLAASMLFNTASFMLYFGQEVGEDAAEGHEGRTSIFQWCKPCGIAELSEYVETGGGLTARRRSILCRYRKLLDLAHREAFINGNVWDLCYCNGPKNGFDADTNFVFLRYSDNDAYIVACNFSDSSTDMTIRVPAELGKLSGQYAISAEAYDFCVVKI